MWSARRALELYRENRVLVWLSLVVFVNQLGFGAIIPVVPLYAKGFGVSQSAIGLTIAVYGFARLMASIPTGQLSDWIGRRWTLVLAEAVTAVGNLLCGLSGSYEQFLLFRFVAGAGAAMMTTSASVILADISTQRNRGRVIGVYHAIFLFGVGIGPLPGGLLAERFGMHVPFFALAALGAVAAVLAFDKVPETRGMRERREGVALAPGSLALAPLTVQLRAVLSNLGFVLISLITFAQFFSRTGAIFVVVPLLGATRLGLSADQIGLGLTLVALPDLLLVYFSGVLVDRFGRKPVIVPSTLMYAAALVGFAAAPNYAWFVASLFMWGIAGGLCGPAPAAYATDLVPRGMNAVAMSCYRMIAEAGYVAGPLALGWISDVISPEAALLATSGLFVVSTLLFALLAPETRVKPHPAPAPMGQGSTS